MLIDDPQPTKRPSVYRPIEDEIERPHVVLTLRPLTKTTVDAAPQTTLLSGFFRHFQSLLHPQSIDSLAVHHEAFLPQQNRDPTVTVARTLPNQLMYPRHQPPLVVRRL